MKFLYRCLGPVSLLALAACGSGTSAPIVHGGSQTHTARIYQSQSEFVSHRDYIREQEAALAARNAPTYPVYQTAAVPASHNNSHVDTAQLPAVHLTQNGLPAEKPVRSQRLQKYTMVVQPGDTVYAIGRRYDVSAQSIMKTNRLKPPYRLEVGQTLRLPRDAKQTATAYRQTASAPTTAHFYTVQRGDTLYSISKDTRLPLSQIAAENNLSRPYRLHIGQRIALPAGASSQALRHSSRSNDTGSIYTSAAPGKPVPLSRTERAENVPDLARKASFTPVPAQQSKPFEWPVKGAVIANYGVSDFGRRNDGVNIAAPAGTPVRAAANGEVVYRGSELDGFGNLLLVKHADGYVTAYAHNDAMLVKKGELVRQGQVIAKVGQTGAVSSPQLHFEVRRNLKAVDPVAMLGSQ